MDEPTTYEDQEQTTNRFRPALLIITACMALLGAYAIYAVFTSGIEWGFDIDWNCFKSPLFPVLAVIGFFLQFFSWQHTSMETWIGTKKQGDSDYKWEKSNDITDAMFGGCLVPILMHLLVIPCLYGAAIWYAIMGTVHLLGKASPFVISALIAGIVFLFYRIGVKTSSNRFRIAILVVLTLLEAGLIGGTAYYMKNHDHISLFGALGGDSEIAEAIGVCEITGNGVNLRVGPGTDFDKSGYSVSAGEAYPLLEESGEWVKIDYNGNALWMSNKFCTLTYKSSGDNDAGFDEDPGCWTGDEEPETTDDQPVVYDAQDGSLAPEGSEETSEAGIANTSADPVSLTGKLDGKYEIVLQYTVREDGTVTGSYYYTKYKTPIQLSGEISGDAMTLEEHTNGNLTGRFIGTVTPDGFNGVWKSADDTKTMECSLRVLN